MKKADTHRPALLEKRTHYCPGCGHGLAHKLICEVVDELGIRKDLVSVAPVGCAVLAYDYFDFDTTETPHGRAPSIATGMKRCCPEKIIFTYQGDGDLAAIGLSEIVHAANRNENITVFFINNAVYGMTGGQMAPTTVLGQRTATTRPGRDSAATGYPVKVSEMLAALEPPYYIERTGLMDISSVKHTKEAIRRAFQAQIDNKGFSLVEILSPCPTYWGVPPQKALTWIKDEMVLTYPLGVKKIRI